MNNPLVSIIVTCYNQAYCIIATLESVAAQTYTNWECIIVDDGSNDTSAEVIKQAIGSDQRFSYHYQDNQGVAKARNIGFAMAKGQYINFLDGDDTFLPMKLEKQVQVFQKHPEIDICICDHQYYYEAEDKYAYYAFEKIKQNPLQQLLYGWHNGVAFPIHSVLHKNTIWNKDEMPFDETYNGRAEDWLFNVTVALKGLHYFFLDQILCNYHQGNHNFTVNNLDNESSFLEAALYIRQNLPIPQKDFFLKIQIKQTLNRYAERQRNLFYKSSGNWRLGNAITSPFFKLMKYVKR
jgi:glycosyltransferase involved in cell wall biosynthesis